MSVETKAGLIDDGNRISLVGAVLAIVAMGYSLAANRRARAPAGPESQSRQRVGVPKQPADDGRGRSAVRPSDIPRRGWWDILKRVQADISGKNLSLIAAGAAFYALLAIPSSITALVSVYGLVFDPRDIRQQVEGLQGLLPADAIRLISEQLQALTAHPPATLGIGLIVSVSLALWSARSGISSMITALNIAYEEPEKRGFLWFQVIAIGLTAGAILFGVVALALIALLPIVLGFLPLGQFGKTVAALAPWPVLIALVMLGLAAVYRFAPSRKEPRWRWVSWGAVLATILWILGSALFSLYVVTFASYDKTYGSLGGVVVLLMWLYLSAFVILLGAALNAQIEHQTARDSTGQELPLGKRGAKMADTVGQQA